MDKLGKILGRVIARQPQGGRVIAARTAWIFRELLGPDLEAACESVELRGSTLTVATSNPALAHQLRLDSELLLARLNQALTERRVKTLRVRTGRSPR
ncbi:MAG TPA: DUF721 domain-containing protein [Candidatus Acidoferrales bacterium]|nr:DUF721 domain-containing protein [Candidatus Acidoferrales bacterium]